VKKGFIHILILILVAVVIGVLVFYSWKEEVARNQKLNFPTIGTREIHLTPTQTPTPTINVNPQPINNTDTMDWNTYTNNKYKYSFRYPTPDKDLAGYDKYTDELISIKGLDWEVIRIEPIDTSETDPVIWWKNQVKETYTNLPKSCFSEKLESKIRSLYNFNELVIDFKFPVLVLNNFYSSDESCHENEAQILLIPHNGKIIRVTHNWAILSEKILATFKLL